MVVSEMPDERTMPQSISSLKHKPKLIGINVNLERILHLGVIINLTVSDAIVIKLRGY